METILIWLGSGFAFASGFAVGVWILRKSYGENVSERENIINKLLEKRNEIGNLQLSTLERIAEAMKNIADSQ